jgi:hypothetical protein
MNGLAMILILEGVVLKTYPMGSKVLRKPMGSPRRFLSCQEESVLCTLNMNTTQLCHMIYSDNTKGGTRRAGELGDNSEQFKTTDTTILVWFRPTILISKLRSVRWTKFQSTITPLLHQ